jgi:hypothetical protein
METLVVFGVGLGNFGRFAPKRVKAAVWIRRLNTTLMNYSEPIKVLTTFGHTGNFVVRSAASREIVRHRLAKALKTPCAAIKVVELKKLNAAISNLPFIPLRQGFRYTRGAAILVSGNASGRLPDFTRRAKYITFSPTVVLVLKKDAVTDRGILDRSRRFGGWGAIGGEIASFLGGRWTARSYRTLLGTLRRAIEAGAADR